MFSRFLPFLFAFLMVFATAGCGSDDDATPDDDQIENPDDGGSDGGDGGDGGSDGGGGDDGGSDGGGGDDGGGGGDDNGTPLTTDEAEDAMTESITKYRTDNDLATWEFHDKLYEKALLHSKNMADGTSNYGRAEIPGYFNELREDGLSFHKAVSLIGRSTKNQPVDEIFADWLENSDYLDRVDDYTHFAVAVAQAEDGTYYFTALFVGMQ